MIILHFHPQPQFKYEFISYILHNITRVLQCRPPELTMNTPKISMLIVLTVCLAFSYFLLEFNRIPELSSISSPFLGLSSPGKYHSKIPGLSRFPRTRTNPQSACTFRGNIPPDNLLFERFVQLNIKISVESTNAD